MNVVINIHGGYMVSCFATKEPKYIMKFLSAVYFVMNDLASISADNGIIEFQSDYGDQIFVVGGADTSVKKKADHVYVVSSFDHWQILDDDVKVFSSYKKAREYYDDLRRASEQYNEIIEADGDNDNFLDDNGYAVFLEKADYIK